ncbi:MAG: DUF2800 domain-containing protein [Enterocloster aldenensis]
MPDVHALLGPSGAKRWMSCPPSARLEEPFPDSSSEYADEGTLAHSLAETILRYNNGEISKKAFSTRLNKIKADPMYNKEMQDYIEDYTQRIWEISNEVKASCPDARILFEQRLDISEYVPDGFGRGDVVIVADDLVDVIDLKYGKGVGVSAKGNPQLRLYGLGAYLEHSMLYDIQKVRMTIIQPRLENISTEELTVEELLDWAEKEVRPKAAQAYAGEGEFRVGDHCRFCKARVTCRARAEYNLELTKLDFVDPALLTDEEIGDVLRRADELDHWVKDITEYALAEALKGTKYEGWKLVEGTSRRKYTDMAKVISTVQDAGYPYDDITKPVEPITITDMTKLIGKKKFEELLSGLVIKPEGKPTLVPKSDKRPELNRVAEAKRDFDNKMDE